MTIPYHSALKGIRLEEAEPCARFEYGKSLAFVHDAFEPVPAEFDQCDFFYQEPPFPHGAKVFDARVNIAGRTYSDLAAHLSRFITATSKPVVMPVAKSALRLLPPTSQTLDVKLVHQKNGWTVKLGVWNTYIGAPKTTEEALHTLLDSYDCVGDLFCGYGHTAFVAAERGKRFVVSDYNPTCIGFIAKELGQK